jgi:iron complex transport system substrate-binding protein
MLRTFRQSIRAGELVWFAPFLGVALLAFSLLRPVPRFPAAAQSRVAVDARGTQMPIEEPFRGVVLTARASGVDDYLKNTRAPETVMMAGGREARRFFAGSLISKVYPDVLQQDRYWDLVNGDWAQGTRANIESLLTYHAGAYLGAGGNNFGMVPFLQSVGLPAFHVYWGTSNWDEQVFSRVRVETALIGQPEAGQRRIARYTQALGDIASELDPDTLLYRPRVLMMTCLLTNRRYFNVMYMRDGGQLYFSRTGIDNASKGLDPQYPDPERLLLMDPDLIFLWGVDAGTYETPREFLRDPRWQGMRAVREKRVYHLPGSAGPGGLVMQPIYERWMAEIANPDRMRPRVRQLLRDRFIAEFNYHLSDEQIDAILNVDENRGMAGAERFERDHQAHEGP